MSFATVTIAESMLVWGTWFACFSGSIWFAWAAWAALGEWALDDCSARDCGYESNHGADRDAPGRGHAAAARFRNCCVIWLVTVGQGLYSFSLLYI